MLSDGFMSETLFYNIYRGGQRLGFDDAIAPVLGVQGVAPNLSVPHPAVLGGTL